MSVSWGQSVYFVPNRGKYFRPDAATTESENACDSVFLVLRTPKYQFEKFQKNCKTDQQRRLICGKGPDQGELRLPENPTQTEYAHGARGWAGAAEGAWARRAACAQAVRVVRARECVLRVPRDRILCGSPAHSRPSTAREFAQLNGTCTGLCCLGTGRRAGRDVQQHLRRRVRWRPLVPQRAPSRQATVAGPVGERV